MTKISVIGGGAWGTALAHIQAVAGRDVTLWAREQAVIDSVNTQQENATYLPGVKLHPSLSATDSLSRAVEDTDILLMVTPAQYLRDSLESLKQEAADGIPLVVCSKGVEIATGMMLSQVVEDVIPDATCAVMTGPTFAREIALGLPSAMTLATNDKDVAADLSENLACRTLRPYLSDDIIGVQIGGAVKNVLAIACGVITGRKMGESARAALMTRGVAEMGRLASALGAKKETLTGMCGFGDLVLTCSSMQSRNYSLGVMLGEGRSVDDVLGERKSVTEGVHTAKALMKLAKDNAVEMPISESVYRCLIDGVNMEDMISEMLNRPFAHQYNQG